MIRSGQAVMVQSGCHIPTMDLFLTADKSEDMEVHSTWLDWTVTLSQLFDHTDTEQITNAVHKIRTTMTGSFDASELLQQLEKLNQPFQSNHWVISSPAAMIGFDLIISLLSFAIWKKCCTKSDKQPALPAPSAPPAVNPGVPLQPAVMAPQQFLKPQQLMGPQPNLNFKNSVAPKTITIINS
jgi:hypothetical protein